eukprot:Amastigsp_a508607_23.p4 type:complete len:120 gc:universal Amastigsp_a508607_23:1211-1570(+)
MARTSRRWPVTFDAAQNDPILTARDLYFLRAATSSPSTKVPVRGQLGSSTTSAMDSRHGRMFEWCSNIEMNTTGRRLPDGDFVPTLLLSPRMPIMRWTAAVEPEPWNVTTSSGPQLSES